LQLTVIINTIVAVLGTIAGSFFAVASVISIANMTVPWRGPLLVAALLVPAAFMLSGIGAWLAHGRSNAPVTIGFVALPWVYGAAFVLVMLLSFKQ
jgi:hypothetical protein